MISEKIAILDAGSQYGKLIDRRVRELHCYCELLPINTPVSLLESSYQGVIISGGPSSFQSKDAPICDPLLISSKIPILGICYGMQWLNIVYKGNVKSGETREDGQIEISIESSNQLFDGMETKQKVLLTHGDSVVDVPDDLMIIATSPHHIAGLKHKNKQQYGVQFHPEVDLTINGKKILENFLFKICKMSGGFKIEDRLEKAYSEIRTQVADKSVVVLVSGGVDSTVCCGLLYKALGKDRVYAIHINNGFMRKNEVVLVKKALEDIGFLLKVVDATPDFYEGMTEIKEVKTKKLKEVVNPEEKRKIIGDTFMRVIIKEIKEIEELTLKNGFYLAQGTLRPDLIESASHLASSKADVIKTHHNDTALVRQKREEGLIIEPLKDYHKDEVRQLGRLLGLPEVLVGRHPFPGPGLAIRILCLDQAYMKEDFPVIELNLKEIAKSRGFKAYLLPIKSVGVQGDGRSYSYVAAIEGKADWKALMELAKEIPKTIHQINRIVYIFGGVEQISVTKTLLTEDVIFQLQEADYIAMTRLMEIDKGAVMKSISQMPVVLIPVSFEKEGDRSIVLRPFITNDFMTGMAAVPGIDLPEEALNLIDKEIREKNIGISRVLLDLTSKPPGTTEWE